jgi:hypothetical protein
MPNRNGAEGGGRATSLSRRRLSPSTYAPWKDGNGLVSAAMPRSAKLPTEAVEAVSTRQARSESGAYSLSMDDVAIQCPYCGERITVEIEPDTEGSLVQDCEVCCRPLQIYVTTRDDRQVSLHVERAQ